MNVRPYTDPEIVARVAVLKAGLNHKTALIYQINRLKIRSNYEKSNKDFKDLKELAPICKLMQKRLNDIRVLNSCIKKIPQKHPDQVQLAKLFELLESFFGHLEVNRQVFSLNFSEENFLEDLKSRHESLQQELSEKSETLNKNESFIQNLSSLEEELPVLESEVNDLYALHSEVTESIQVKENNRAKSRIHHKKSLEQVKLFQKLSENGIVLRSKLLLRQELLRNLKIAEKELETLETSTKNNSEKLKIIELEKKEQAKELHRLQQDFLEVKKEIIRLEMRLEGLLSEKDAILDCIYEEKPLNGDSSRSEFIEEETIQVTSWLSGFSEMLKEKETLVQENAKLKERISKLFKPKQVPNKV